VSNDGDSNSVGSSSFSVDDVHHIGILDIRLFNMDRNGENLLIKKDGRCYRLIPIDHSYILPPRLDQAYFEWLYWSQASKPFKKDSLDFIHSIDVDTDAALLRGLGFPEENIRTMMVSTLLLKHCASLGKNLFEIASMMCRDCFSGSPSLLEVLVAKLPSTGNYPQRLSREFSELLRQHVK